ncbi:MAG: hypothetical protein GOV15_03755 [Candidatus Diapherotrites archaeon]|nr:hypothetical protein [Candidatus Diapherotrites archaeon]
MSKKTSRKKKRLRDRFMHLTRDERWRLVFASTLLVLVTVIGGLYFVLTPLISQNSTADACISICKEHKAVGADLSAGPCLSNVLADDWVCDVAHSPRMSVDNNPENQCDSYGQTATRFVEVSPDCDLIRSG